MKLYQVDAFTETPFHGNPAAVCILDTVKSDDWFRAMAAEMNLSETAFVLPQKDGFSLRWFTPKMEVSLCGHATLATAHVLWEENILQPQEKAEFHTMSGLLTVSKEDSWINMNFPARLVEETAPCEELNRALGFAPLYSGYYQTPKGVLYLLEAATPEMVRGLTPDFPSLTATGARAVIVTARSDRMEWDFVSRYFAPAVGINEDPVTGSAHCCLAPYWDKKLSKKSLTGFQASPRSGMVRCEWMDDRVILKGKAVTIFRGEVAEVV